MSLDDPRFRFSPYCSFSALNVVAPSPDGVWHTTNEHGDTSTLSAEDFRDRAISLQSDEMGAGIYSIVAEGDNGKPRRFAVIEAEKSVIVEGFEQPIGLEEFRTLAVRTTPEGRHICSMAESLSTQWEKCKQTSGADDHIMDIRELAALYGDSTQSSELYDHHMYNLVSSEVDDGLSYMEIMKMVTAPHHVNGPVHERFALNEVLDNWSEVRNLPTFMQGSVRIAFDNFMKDMLGEYPYEKVVMTSGRNVQYSESLEEAGFDLIGIVPPFVGGNMLPGYKTGDVAFHRSKGVDVVVFSDFMGTYAYAWPTEEGGRFEPSDLSIQKMIGM